jgi:hypothetical protein
MNSFHLPRTPAHQGLSARRCTRACRELWPQPGTRLLAKSSSEQDTPVTGSPGKQAHTCLPGASASRDTPSRREPRRAGTHIPASQGLLVNRCTPARQGLLVNRRKPLESRCTCGLARRLTRLMLYQASEQADLLARLVQVPAR